MEITKEQYEIWRTQRITQEIFKVLSKMRDEFKEQLAGGAVLNSASGEQTLAAYSRVLGIIEGIDQVLNMDFEEGEE